MAHYTAYVRCLHARCLCEQLGRATWALPVGVVRVRSLGATYARWAWALRAACCRYARCLSALCALPVGVVRAACRRCARCLSALCALPAGAVRAACRRCAHSLPMLCALPWLYLGAPPGCLCTLLAYCVRCLRTVSALLAPCACCLPRHAHPIGSRLSSFHPSASLLVPMGIGPTHGTFSSSVKFGWR